MNLREAAQMALEALQESKPIDINDPTAFYRSAHAIEALRAALAQPEPEPVAYMDMYGQVYNLDELNGDLRIKYEMKIEGAPTPLYCAPPQREWQGLTDEQIQKIEMSASSKLSAIYITEAQLKGKNS